MVAQSLNFITLSVLVETASVIKGCKYGCECQTYNERNNKPARTHTRTESPLRCCLRPLGTALSATPSCTKTRGERVLLGLEGGNGRLRAEATVSAASSPILVCVCEVRVCARAPSAARPGALSALGGSLFRFLFDSCSILFYSFFCILADNCLDFCSSNQNKTRFPYFII